MTMQELEARAKQEVKDNAERVRPGRYYVPEVDIYEDGDALWLWADMPGIDSQRVSVALNDDVLTVQGEVNLEEYEGLSPAYTEYNVGHFSRRFNLPYSARVDREKIAARVVDGVLEVKLPKSEAAKPRRIQVAAT